MSVPRKVRCKVDAIIDHGGHVYTVDLKPAGTIPAFQPGQFLHLTVDAYDPSSFWPESRVFSIASSPRDTRNLRICYAVKGRYTERMEQVLRVGGEVWAKLPYGDFLIDSTRASVLLAGGTGISAFTAFIAGLTPEQPQPVWLVYGARRPELLLFLDLVAAQLERVPAFRALYFCESGCEGTASEPADARATRILPGRIDLATVWAAVPGIAGMDLYLAGPPLMQAALTSQLAARGVSADHVHTDAWE